MGKERDSRGKIMEELGRGIRNQNILHENVYFSMVLGIGGVVGGFEVIVFDII